MAVIMALLLFLAPVLCIYNAPGTAYDLTVQYVRICGVGIVFVVAYNESAASSADWEIRSCR